MILQALNRYYERMINAHPGELSEFGFERKSIPVIFDLSEKGELQQISIDSEKTPTKQYVLPKGVKRTSGVAPNLLWDSAEYVIGFLHARAKVDAVAKKHKAFVRRVLDFDLPDIGLKAVQRFLIDLDEERLRARTDFDDEVFQTNPNISFRLVRDGQLVCERSAIREAIKRNFVEDEAKSVCLVTGERTSTERLHPSIKGVWGAQSSGANIVSFNLDAFTSFNSKQGENSPVSTIAAFNYTEALNYLLRKGSPQRMQMGDTSSVFWSDEGDQEIENAFLQLMALPEKTDKDDPNRGANHVKAALESFYRGRRISPVGDQRFYILGLAPNASRISIRFWKMITIAELCTNVCLHYEDIQISPPYQQPMEIPLARLLAHLCLERKLSNLAPNISGEVIRSVLDNKPYPASLLSAAVRRNRAEQNVTFERAAIIKACINRQARQSRIKMKELTMSLDLTNTSPSYLLGRWFAVLEKIQKDAHPKINKTIKDRYYGAMSSNPDTVFATLDRLKNHHLAKLEKESHKIYYEKKLGEIVGLLPADLPKRLSLAEQATFSVGYYHQVQDLYSPSTTSEKPKENTVRQD